MVAPANASITHFSNGSTFGLDKSDRITGFAGVNLVEVPSTARIMTVPNTASGGVLAPHTTQVMSHSIRIESANGTPYYVMLTNAATNRTGGG